MKAAHLAAVLMFAMPAAADPMAICRGPVRVTCVVDGDTIWIEGEKIRVADIDAPEIEGHCRSERTKAAQARSRHSTLLDHSPITIERSGIDRFGRTLAILKIDGSSVGEVLVREGLARSWAPHGRRPWC